MQHPAAAADGQRRAVTRGIDPVAARLHADQRDVGVADERREHPDRVRATADARDHAVRQPTGRLQHLFAGLVADHPLEVSDERRERRRADGRADDVVGRRDVRHPVADRGRGRLLERPRARFDGLDGRAQQPHPLDVGVLAAHVLGAHVDDTFEIQQRARRGRRDPVLAGPGLGDDPRLAHPPGQQRLTERVVDLVRAGVVEVLAFEVDLVARRPRSAWPRGTAATGARRSHAPAHHAAR